MEIKNALGLICYAVMFMNLHKVMKETKFRYVLPLAISNFFLAFAGAQLLFN